MTVKVKEVMEVMKNIKYIFDQYPDFAEKISISMVMDPSNDYDCINSLEFYGSKFNQININATLIDKDYDFDNEISFSEDYVWKFEYQCFWH